MEVKSEAAEDARGIRGLLNRHPAATGGAVLVLTVACLSMAFKPIPKPKAYYTVDDGKTYFEAAVQVPPFTTGGREAVRAMVFSCDGGKTRFVGYLLRHPPDEREAAAAILKKGGRMPPGEVKRPGETEWASPFNPTKLKGPMNEATFKKAQAAGKRYDEIQKVKCPEGGGHALIVNPG